MLDQFLAQSRKTSQGELFWRKKKINYTIYIILNRKNRKNTLSEEKISLKNAVGKQQML